MFFCNSSKICIASVYTCDGKFHCDNGEDEIGCSIFYFNCQNGVKISSKLVCDHTDHCGNNFDEINCGK